MKRVISTTFVQISKQEFITLKVMLKPKIQPLKLKSDLDNLKILHNKPRCLRLRNESDSD